MDTMRPRQPVGGNPGGGRRGLEVVLGRDSAGGWEHLPLSNGLRSSAREGEKSGAEPGRARSCETVNPARATRRGS